MRSLFQIYVQNPQDRKHTIEMYPPLPSPGALYASQYDTENTVLTQSGLTYIKSDQPIPQGTRYALSLPLQVPTQQLVHGQQPPHGVPPPGMMPGKIF